jgi:hypothetical protein
MASLRLYIFCINLQKLKGLYVYLYDYFQINRTVLKVTLRQVKYFKKNRSINIRIKIIIVIYLHKIKILKICY